MLDMKKFVLTEMPDKKHGSILSPDFNPANKNQFPNSNADFCAVAGKSSRAGQFQLAVGSP